MLSPMDMLDKTIVTAAPHFLINHNPIILITVRSKAITLYGLKEIAVAVINK